jgi:hypothetical protein
MSGVIGDDGVQWERCNQCAGWERFELLAYAEPNPALPMPSWYAKDPSRADICQKCMAGIPWKGKYRDQLLNK